MLVERVDGDLGATGHHPGGELALGVAADASGKDELDLIRTTDVEVVGDRRLEEGADPAGSVEDDGAADFDLAHGEFPPESGQSIGCPKWGGDDRHPAFEEGVNLVRAEAITDGLESGRVAARGEPVGKRAEVETRSMRLVLGPLVPVDPDLAGVGEVRTDLDEAVTEVGVVDIEVVGTHPSVGLVEAERWWSAVVVTPRSRKDRLELLRSEERRVGK